MSEQRSAVKPFREFSRVTQKFHSTDYKRLFFAARNHALHQKAALTFSLLMFTFTSVDG
jgi:hypothetical protein